MINIARSHNPTEARLHLAGCWTINGQNPAGGTLTGPYMEKICAEQLAELEHWASDQVGGPIRPCGTCHPARDAVQDASTKPTQRAHGAPMLERRYSLVVQGR